MNMHDWQGNTLPWIVLIQTAAFGGGLIAIGLHANS